MKKVRISRRESDMKSTDFYGKFVFLDLKPKNQY